MIEWIRFIAGTAFLMLGIVIFGIEIFGVYRYRYVLNRMHMAAFGDTFGIGAAMIGLMIFSGLNFTTLKMFFIVLFLWFSSPVSSHMITLMEVETAKDLQEHMEVKEE